MPRITRKSSRRQASPEQHTARRVFPEPALLRETTARPRLRLTPNERRDRARLEAIGRVPVLERTPSDLAFEECFGIGDAYPEAVADAIAGILAGVRTAERRTGREIMPPLRVEMDGLHPQTAAAVLEALRRGVEL